MTNDTITIRPNTVIPVPATDLKELRKIIAYDGMLLTIQDNTGVQPYTSKTIAKNGHGRKEKVDLLIDFVRKFNKTVA